jgi:tRNA A-37 threonylcarbamoyl transferase component Bud32
LTAENLTIDVERKVGEALTAIHKLGVIHGDIRLANILVGKDGTVWFIDFEASIFSESIKLAETRESMFQCERDTLIRCLKRITNTSKEVNIVGNGHVVNQLAAH